MCIPFILDIEASGFGQDSYPIEVGVITDSGRRYCRLIKRQQDWNNWSEEAESLHGISRQLLDKKGVSVGQICYELNKMLKGKTVYSDGWVVDYPWMITLFHAARTEMAFKVSPLEAILSEEQMATWDQTRAFILAKEPITRHRASTDAELIQKVFVTTQRTSLGYDMAM